MVNIEIANKFINYGYCLMPLQENTKITKNKWKDRSKTELNRSTISTKSNNFAIRTGKISGIYVLDIDNYKKECEIMDKLQEIDTFKVKTPRGGLHLYFKYNKLIKTTTNEKLAIDIRSDNGYVVAPTSSIDGNEYIILNDIEPRDTPSWLLEYIFNNFGGKKSLSNAPKGLSATLNTSSLPDSPTKKSNIPFEELREKVLGLSLERSSNYNDWLKIGFIIQHTSIENNYFEKGRELFHEFSERCEEKYDEEKTNNIYDNIRDTDNKTKYPTLCLLYNEDNFFQKNSSASEDEYFGDKDCALKLYNKHKNNIVYTSFGIYCKHPITGIWVNNHEQMFKIYIQNSELYTIDKNKKQVYIRDQTTKWKSIIIQIETYIHSNIKPDEKFIEKLDNYNGYIPFLNCCYDLVNQKWIDKLPDKFACSKVINLEIDYNKQPTSEEKEQVNIWLDSILEEYKQEFLCYCVRMLGGHYLDKKWMASIGLRNSGKGVLELIFRHLFGNFVGQLDAKNLEQKKNSMESAERSRGYLEPCCTTKLVFSSEARANKIMDGVDIKKISSGGDILDYRQSSGLLRKGYLRAGFIMQANCLPEFDPSDTAETMLYLSMPCKFVEESEINNNYGGYKVKIADPQIKTKIIDEKFRMAFYSVVFSYYQQSNNSYSLLVKEAKEFHEEEGSNFNEFQYFEAKIKEQYEITNNYTDFVKTTEIHAFVKNSNLAIRCDRIKKYLKSLGCKEDTNEGRRYKGIKNIDKTVENDEC